MKKSDQDKANYERQIIDGSARPKLKSFVIMRRDDLRRQWVVLSPERIMTLDEVARAILKLCDGVRSVDEIAVNLTKAFQAPKDVIEADVIEFLQELNDQLLLDQ